MSEVLTATGTFVSQTNSVVTMTLGTDGGGGPQGPIVQLTTNNTVLEFTRDTVDQLYHMSFVIDLAFNYPPPVPTNVNVTFQVLSPMIFKESGTNTISGPTPYGAILTLVETLGAFKTLIATLTQGFGSGIVGSGPLQGTWQLSGTYPL